MKQSGIQDTDQLLDQKISNQSTLAKTLLDFVRLTQDHFTIRSGTQERWDVKTLDWMKDSAQQPDILKALQTLGLMDTVVPQFKQRDAICILGASKSAMFSRLAYAGDLFIQNRLPTHWLILLAGERYVTPDKNGIFIDGEEKELLALSKKLNKRLDQLTETDLIVSAYKASKFYNTTLQAVTIDTPRRDLPRPTTETTVRELCLWLKNHPQIQSITFVSNQPHVKYQHAIIAEVFKSENLPITFEVIGTYTPSIVPNPEDQIKYVVGALGSQIWAATPGVLETLKIDLSDPLLQQYTEMYKKQPLIYKNLGKKHNMRKPH